MQYVDIGQAVSATLLPALETGACWFLGTLFNRKNWLPRHRLPLVAQLIGLLLIPCLAFRAAVQSARIADPSTVVLVVANAVVSALLGASLGLGSCKLLGLQPSSRHARLLVFSAAFGSAGLPALTGAGVLCHTPNPLPLASSRLKALAAGLGSKAGPLAAAGPAAAAGAAAAAAGDSLSAESAAACIATTAGLGGVSLAVTLLLALPFVRWALDPGNTPSGCPGFSLSGFLHALGVRPLTPLLPPGASTSTHADKKQEPGSSAESGGTLSQGSGLIPHAHPTAAVASGSAGPPAAAAAGSAGSLQNQSRHAGTGHDREGSERWPRVSPGALCLACRDSPCCEDGCCLSATEVVALPVKGLRVRVKAPEVSHPGLPSPPGAALRPSAFARQEGAGNDRSPISPMQTLEEVGVSPPWPPLTTSAGPGATGQATDGSNARGHLDGWGASPSAGGSESQEPGVGLGEGRGAVAPQVVGRSGEEEGGSRPELDDLVDETICIAIDNFFTQFDEYPSTPLLLSDLQRCASEPSHMMDELLTGADGLSSLATAAAYAAAACDAAEPPAVTGSSFDVGSSSCSTERRGARTQAVGKPAREESISATAGACTSSAQAWPRSASISLCGPSSILEENSGAVVVVDVAQLASRQASGYGRHPGVPRHGGGGAEAWGMHTSAFGQAVAEAAYGADLEAAGSSGAPNGSGAAAVVGAGASCAAAAAAAPPRVVAATDGVSTASSTDWDLQLHLHPQGQPQQQPQPQQFEQFQAQQAGYPRHVPNEAVIGCWWPSSTAPQSSTGPTPVSQLSLRTGSKAVAAGSGSLAAGLATSSGPDPCVGTKAMGGSAAGAGGGGSAGSAGPAAMAGLSTKGKGKGPAGQLQQQQQAWSPWVLEALTLGALLAGLAVGHSPTMLAALYSDSSPGCALGMLTSAASHLVLPFCALLGGACLPGSGLSPFACQDLRTPPPLPDAMVAATVVARCAALPVAGCAVVGIARALGVLGSAPALPVMFVMLQQHCAPALVLLPAAMLLLLSPTPRGEGCVGYLIKWQLVAYFGASPLLLSATSQLAHAWSATLAH